MPCVAIGGYCNRCLTGAGAAAATAKSVVSSRPHLAAARTLGEIRYLESSGSPFLTSTGTLAAAAASTAKPAATSAAKPAATSTAKRAAAFTPGPAAVRTPDPASVRTSGVPASQRSYTKASPPGGPAGSVGQDGVIRASSAASLSGAMRPGEMRHGDAARQGDAERRGGAVGRGEGAREGQPKSGAKCMPSRRSADPLATTIRKNGKVINTDIFLFRTHSPIEIVTF